MLVFSCHLNRLPGPAFNQKCLSDLFKYLFHILIIIFLSFTLCHQNVTHANTSDAKVLENRVTCFCSTLLSSCMLAIWYSVGLRRKRREGVTGQHRSQGYKGTRAHFTCLSIKQSCCLLKECVSTTSKGKHWRNDTLACFTVKIMHYVGTLIYHSKLKKAISIFIGRFNTIQNTWFSKIVFISV